MKSVRIALLASGLAIGAAAPARARSAETGTSSACSSLNGIVAICDFRGPEDLAITPDGATLIVSEVGLNVDGRGQIVPGRGHISLLDPVTSKRRPIAYLPQSGSTSTSWGDPSCALPPTLSPGGIHLSVRPDGAPQLFVVNYATPNSVQMFEVAGTGQDRALSWRGCVTVPSSALLNDVAALSGGGFVATVIKFGDDPLQHTLAMAEQGLNTGFVIRWRPGLGTDLVPGSLLPMANGIEVNRAGDTIFVVSSRTRGEVRKINLATGAVLGVTYIASPDNLSWSSDGKLLVTANPAVVKPCDGRTSCSVRYEVVTIDPETMMVTARRSLDGGPDGKPVSVVLEVGDAYFLGSPAADRILMTRRNK